MSASKKIMELDVAGGSVNPAHGCAGALDTLALAAKNLVLIREALAEVPGIGQWLLAGFNGFDSALLQFFPNQGKIPTREGVQASAEMFMSHVGGKWKPQGHLGEGRVGSVQFPDVSHRCIVILHNVDGLVVEKEAADA